MSAEHPTIPAHTLRGLAWRILSKHRAHALFFASSIAVGIAFLFALGNLLDGINDNIARQARSLMAADLTLQRSQPLPRHAKAWLQQPTQTQHFTHHQIISFASMLQPHPPHKVAHPSTMPQSTPSSSKPSSSKSRPSSSHNASKRKSRDSTPNPPSSQALRKDKTPFLVSVKAVPPAYPYYGVLKVHPKTWRKRFFTRDVCLIDKSIKVQHSLEIGDRIRLGVHTFTIQGILEEEPDQLSGGGFAAFAPRVLIPLQTASKTGLLQIGSRITYKTLLKWKDPHPPIQELRALKAQIQGLKLDKTRITLYSESNPTLRELLKRVVIFFLFLSLIALLLGSIGMAASVTSFLNEQMENVGLLRSLGLRPEHIRTLYMRICLYVGMLGGVLGIGLGILLSIVGLQAVGSALGISVAWQLYPLHLFESVGLALLLTLGLNFATIQALSRLAPHLILRRSQHQIPLSVQALTLTAVGLFFGFFLYAVRSAYSWLLGGVFTLTLSGMLLYCLVMILLFLALFRAGEQILQSNHRWLLILRHGWRQLVRQRVRSLTYLLALTTGFTLLLSLQTLQHSFSKELQVDPTETRPNLFLIDVQPHQISSVRRLLNQYDGKAPLFSPLVRARLTHINQKEITAKTLKGASLEARMRANAIRREYNLSYKHQLNRSERILKGRFWKPNTQAIEVSLEQRWAQRLNVRLGDTLTFDILGRPVRGPITSIRKVQWRSRLPNFLVVLTPFALNNAPQQHVTSVALHDPQKIAAFQRALLQKHPNISVIDLGIAFKKIQSILNAFLLAMQILSWVILMIGLLILAGTLSMGQQERLEKIALLRAIGTPFTT
ncbi:MAG: FtsX-like permease family protein, partial [Myxococcota bacterium]